MPFGITPLHVILILAVALIILGPGMLPKVGTRVGKSIREFRQAVPATRDAFTSEVSAPVAGDETGTGAAVGTKVGSVAAKSVRGFRASLAEARDAFQNEVSPTSGSAPTAAPGTPAAPAVSEPNAESH